MRVGTKLSKNIKKQLFLCFASGRRLRDPSLLMLWISSVKLQNPIIYETASLAAFLGVSLDRLINTFYAALNTENRTHT